jgi:carboxypeptidase Q
MTKTMKIKRISISLLLLLLMPLWLLAQTEKIDLEMIYKIKQEGMNNSKIEDLAFGITDMTGPRLTGSAGFDRGAEWVKKKMEEFGF